MNPIFWREARVRPRARLAPFFLPAACVPAAALLLACVARARGSNAATDGGQIAFQTLAILLTLAWLVIAAASTAGTIAAERERGLLESLQLSGMTPLAIVTGKLTASLAFTAVVMFTTLPVLALAALLGGIETTLAARVALLHVATALLGAAVGLAWSAWTRRAAAALRVTLICLAIWGVGSALAGTLAQNNGPQGAQWAAWLVAALRLAGATNPISAAFSLFSNTDPPPLLLMPAPSRALQMFDAFAATSPFLISVGFQLSVATILFGLAMRGVRTSFDEAPQVKQAKRSTVDFDLTPRARKTAEDAPFYDIPFVARLRFANPILAREIKGKFRQPRVPRWVVWTQSALGLCVLGFYGLVAWWALVRPASRAQTWWVIAFTGLFVVMTSAPMMGAANFSRERERGTWEGVLLTPLAARSISGGKIGSALLAIAAFSLPLLPLLALCVGRAGGVSWAQAALTFALIGATAYSFSALGTLASWKATRTAPVAAAMLLFVAAQSVAPFFAVRPALHGLIAFNPPSALALVAGAGRAFGLPGGVAPIHLQWALGTTFFLLLIGAWLEALVCRALRKQGHP